MTRGPIMREKFVLLLTLAVVVVILIGLNALTFVQREELPDSEERPNRSTFNAGATGTRALFDLLRQSGREAVRWQEPITVDFEEFDAARIDTFVIIGSVRREIEEEEVTHLLAWVAAGGQLVVVDRQPNPDLLRTSAAWEISIGEGRNSLSASEKGYLIFSVDPSNSAQMTDRTAAVSPVQPTVFNAQINGVQPSKFASSIRLSRVAADEAPEAGEGDSIDDEPDVEEEETPLTGLAPVVHLANADRNLVVDYPFGAGRIVVIADPYVVANGGISLADNAQAAVNILSSRSGPIVFDEYHHGFGNDRNRLISYFSGTPVIAILLQVAALAAFVLFSRGRRFARPLPSVEPDRLSKLEYVSAMAQLQGRTKAFDLAVENIYTDFRRRVARFFAVDNFTVPKEKLAALISARLGTDPAEIVEVMERCEDIMHGGKARRSEVLKLVRKLREIEDALGLVRGRK